MFSESDFEIYRHAWRFNKAPHLEPQLTDSQCKALLKKGGWIVRNTFAFDCNTPTEFWYLIKDSFGGIEELVSDVRNMVRRSLQIFEYKLIDIELLRNKAYPILKATYDDYQMSDRKMNESVFGEYLDYWSKNNFDYWGVFDKESDEFVGFCAVHVWDDACEYGLMGFNPKYKHNASYPYYGFFYKMNEYYLQEKKFRYVADGARSITNHSNVQPFLIKKFKFRKAYCSLKIRYKWWFGVIVKVLLPFRKIIRNRNVRAVLNMHMMQS